MKEVQFRYFNKEKRKSTQLFSKPPQLNLVKTTEYQKFA